MLLFLDSFDHYAAANLLAKYDSTNAAAVEIGTDGRTFSCLEPHQQPGSSLSSYVRKNLVADVGEIITGFAYYVAAMPTSGSWPIISFTNNGAWLGSLFLDSVGRLFYGFSPNTVNDSTYTQVTGFTPGATIVPATWCYLELRVLLKPDTTGAVVLHVSGVELINATGIQTTLNAAALASVGVTSNTNQFNLRSHNNGTDKNVRFDDLYVFDTTGTVNNAFVGDNKVACMIATGDGAVLGLSPSTGTTHYSLVDEIPPDDDISYVSSPTIGAADLYVMSDLPPDVLTVHGVQVGMYARKDDASTRIIAAYIYDGVHAALAGGNRSLPQSYSYQLQQWDTNPLEVAGTAWSVAAVNGLQVGMKIIS